MPVRNGEAFSAAVSEAKGTNVSTGKEESKNSEGNSTHTHTHMPAKHCV